MIPIFAADELTRNPIVFGSTPNITLNDPNDDADDTYLVEDATVQPSFDAVIDPLPDRDGMQSHAPRKMQLMIAIRGWVKSTSVPALIDKIRALNRAFDPVLNYLDDTSTYDKGFLPLDFNLPTADTTNYPTGLIPVRYYVTPTAIPVPLTTKFDGFSARFVITLRAVDPRLYAQTATTVQRTGSGTVTANLTLGTYPLWPIVTCAFSTTAPTGSPTIQRTTPTGTETITLVSSLLAANKTLIIDAQSRTAEYSDGTDKITALSYTSQFFQLMHAQSNVVTFTGFPADSTLSVTYRVAYAG